MLTPCQHLWPLMCHRTTDFEWGSWDPFFGNPHPKPLPLAQELMAVREEGLGRDRAVSITPLTTCACTQGPPTSRGRAMGVGSSLRIWDAMGEGRARQGQEWGWRMDAGDPGPRV